MSVLMPEIVIRSFLLQAIAEIKADVNGYADLIFGSLAPVGGFDVKAEMKGIFNVASPFNIKFGINIATAELPAVHVYLPSEEYSFSGIGTSPDFIFDSVNNKIIEDDEIYYNANYSIMIVDNNADKVLILYQVLKFMLYRYSHALELEGFNTLKISGNDLTMQQNIVPATFFARNINLSFVYNFVTRNLIVQLGGHDLVIDKTINMKK